MSVDAVVRPDQVTLGVLISRVSREEVDAAVEVCGVRERRSDGKLPAHVAVYLTLGLALFPDDDYTEVAARVTG
ncbi:transposase domain-containing protein, partial [Micromonospora marina]